MFGNIYQKTVLPVLHSPVFGFFFDHNKEKHQAFLELLHGFYKLDPKSTDYELHGLELICRIWRTLFHELSLLKGTPPLKRLSPAREYRMKQMLDFIHRHYPEPVTVEMIARSANTNKRECFRCFQASISHTPIEYLNRYRLSVAAYLLTSTTQNLTSICEQCGFNNVSYFGKFGRITALPPAITGSWHDNYISFSIVLAKNGRYFRYCKPFFCKITFLFKLY